MWIRAGGKQNAHHLDVRSIGCHDERRRADGVVVATSPRSAESWRTDRHLKIRVRTVRQQRLHELQLGLTIWNTADRIDEPVDRIRQSVFPRARRPVEGSEPGVEDVGIRAAIQEGQREPYVAADGGDAQRRAAGNARTSALAESSWPCALGRAAARLRSSIGFGIRSPSDVDVDAAVQEDSNRFQVAGAGGKVQCGKSRFRMRLEIRLRLDEDL